MVSYVLAFAGAAVVAAILAFKLVSNKLWFFSRPSKTSRLLDFDLVKNPPANVEIELDQAKRDKVLKNSFSLDKVPQDVDAIIIGSGPGGLSTGALLAKAGKKVLVLEQHDQAGGCCHVFAEKGFEFDVGIHYVGKMKPGDTNRLITDQLTNGRLQWEMLDDIYDIIAIGKDYETKYTIKTGRDEQIRYLIDKFPEEEKAIRSFYAKMDEAVKCSTPLAMLKALPKFLAKLLIASEILKWFFPSMKYLTKTVTDVLNETTDNIHLRAVLAYCFGNYGTPPGEAPFLMHSFLLLHFIQGSYYPRGGSSEIAYNIIPVIEGAGGRVLVRVKVNSIIIEDGTAVGVSVTKGKNQHELYAPIIISNAGLMNTVNKLLPPNIVKEHKMDKLIKKVKPGPAFLMIFIGLDGTKEELGLKAQNVWAFKDADLETIVERYFSLSPEDSQTSDVPLMFLSFPSAKDPTFNLRYPGKSTCAIVTVTPYHWFQEWKDEKVKHRGEDYESFKSHFGRKLWEQVLCMYPQLDGKLEYIEVGTPLSNQYYLESFNGEVYGLDHDVTRFNPSMQMELRAETPIPGLFMSGQDTFTDGLSGALYSGLFTASAILKHNILAELFQLRSLWKAKNKSA